MGLVVNGIMGPLEIGNWGYNLYKWSYNPTYNWWRRPSSEIFLPIFMGSQTKKKKKREAQGISSGVAVENLPIFQVAGAVRGSRCAGHEMDTDRLP